MLGVLDCLYFQAELVCALGSSIGNIVDVFTKAGGKIEKVDAGEIGAALARIEPEKIKALQPKILSQIITPDNRFLGDEQTIEDWFSRPENTGDIWEVIFKGAIKLLGEYRPSFLKGVPLKAVTQEATEATA